MAKTSNPYGRGSMVFAVAHETRVPPRLLLMSPCSPRPLLTSPAPYREEGWSCMKHACARAAVVRSRGLHCRRQTQHFRRFTPPPGSGFTRSGFTRSGFTRSGFTRSGFTRSGFTRSGFTPPGFSPVSGEPDPGNSAPAARETARFGALAPPPGPTCRARPVRPPARSGPDERDSAHTY